MAPSAKITITATTSRRMICSCVRAFRAEKLSLSVSL